jgi:hypothetical protein
VLSVYFCYFFCLDATELDYASVISRSFDDAERHRKLKATNEDRIQWLIENWRQLGYSSDIMDMRARFLSFLADSIACDDVTAELILLTLLSRVYHRSETSMPFGHFSLNIICGLMHSQEIGSIIENLRKSIDAVVPMCTQLNLSIEDLCTDVYYPQKVRRRMIIMKSVFIIYIY